MSYERLNLQPNDTWKAEHVDHIEDAIESKQDKIISEAYGLVKFEQGTISADGSLTANTNRVRTSDYYDVETFISASIGSTFYFWMAGYDESKKIIAMNSATRLYSITKEELQESYPTYKYIKFVVPASGVVPSMVEPYFAITVNLLDNIATMSDSLSSTRAEVNSLSNIVGAKIYGTQTDIPFYQGGWNATTGAIEASATRIHTDILDATSIYGASCTSGRIWFMTFNSGMSIVRIDTGTNYQGHQDIKFNALPNEKYIRFVMTNNSTSAAITPEFNSGFTLTVDSFNNTVNAIVADATKDLSQNRTIGTFGNPEYFIETDAWSDATWVGDKYVAIAGTDDDLSTATPYLMKVLSFDNGIANGRTSTDRYYHIFGHANTIDYSPVNDCLIMGNGSGDYKLPGKIFIIPNFSSIISSDAHKTENDPLTLENTNAIVIDCTEYNLGTKFNVVWGELNKRKQNIAYLITAKFGSSVNASDGGDNGTIRRILLGTGSTQLEYGVLNESATENEFNGTFKILDTYTQEGTRYANCNQGSCFYRGEIYSAIGHDGIWMWKMRLGDGKIAYDEWKQYCYDDNGEIMSTNVSSCCIKDGYLYIGALNVGIMAFKL